MYLMIFLVATRRLVSFQSKRHIMLELSIFLFQASEGLVGLCPPECWCAKMVDRCHHCPRHHLLCVAVPCHPLSRSQAEDQVSCHQNTEGNFFSRQIFWRQNFPPFLLIATKTQINFLQNSFLIPFDFFQGLLEFKYFKKY